MDNNTHEFIKNHKNKILITYLRDKKNIPYGVIVATKINGKIKFGYSLCNTKSGDRFSKERGRQIAIDRMFNEKFQNKQTDPQTLNKIDSHMAAMSDRVNKYFSS